MVVAVMRDCQAQRMAYDNRDRLFIINGKIPGGCVDLDSVFETQWLRNGKIPDRFVNFESIFGG